MSVRNKRTAILAGLVVLATSFFGLSKLEPFWWDALGSARLVSIAELPDIGDSCDRPTSAPPEQNLFAGFGETPVYAQGSSTNTVNVDRPPARYIRDSDPIY